MNEYEKMVELYWQGNIEVLEGKPVLATEIQDGLAWNKTRIFAMRKRLHNLFTNMKI
jgi:hypothetical protein